MIININERQVTCPLSFLQLRDEAVKILFMATLHDYFCLVYTKQLRNSGSTDTCYESTAYTTVHIAYDTNKSNVTSQMYPKLCITTLYGTRVPDFIFSIF